MPDPIIWKPLTEERRTVEPSPESVEPVTENAWRLHWNNGELDRQSIRSMNILDRPNRLGHFYGNTVRRRAHRN